MKTVAFVPIRTNSKRIIGKNLQPLGDHPLLYYVLNTLTQVEGIDQVYAYCSDTAIAPLLPQGAELLPRPTRLDQDSTLGQEIYDAFTDQVDADIYLLAHTTSPFIKADTIREALHKVQHEGYDSAFSAQKIQTFTWYQGKPLNYTIEKIPRTQDIDPIYVETSAFYIFRKEVWKKQHRRIGSNPYIAIVDHQEAIDIDWPEDMAFAQKLM